MYRTPLSHARTFNPNFIHSSHPHTTSSLPLSLSLHLFLPLSPSPSCFDSAPPVFLFCFLFSVFFLLRLIPPVCTVPPPPPSSLRLRRPFTPLTPTLHTTHPRIPPAPRTGGSHRENSRFPLIHRLSPLRFARRPGSLVPAIALVSFFSLLHILPSLVITLCFTDDAWRKQKDINFTYHVAKFSSLRRVEAASGRQAQSVNAQLQI